MKRKTTEDFIKQSRKIHSDKYDYSLVKYVNSITKVKIICPEHGIFEQIPNNHLRNRGCIKCSYRKTTDDFIKDAKKVHGNKYDYSLVKYETNKIPIKIICSEHGVFEQRPDDHLKGHGCPKYDRKNLINKSLSDFIKDAKKVHGNKYDYSLVEYKNNKIPIKIICSEHGIFKQRPDSHLNGKGCNICNESRGENKIRNYLIKLNINYLFQHKFKNCKNKRQLPFDFYLPDYNICIEYDGIQHFEINEHFGGKDSFDKLKINDNKKNEFCIKNNIKLIRIPYTKFKDIENIIINFLNQ